MTIIQSDKFFWHRYIDAYERAFDRLGEVKRIMEIGIFHGASVRWLSERFPQADIMAIDILPVQPEWPRSDRITYHEMDQGHSGRLRQILSDAGGLFDLVIEDGSHIPQHQASSLNEGLCFVRPGGLYILEDISTSHPDHPDFSHYSRTDDILLPNALHVLMAIQHVKESGKVLTPEIATALTAPGFFDSDEIHALNDRIERLDLYKRTSLPLRCWSCGQDEFDYTYWRCRCGKPLYDVADSMSFIIERSASG